MSDVNYSIGIDLGGTNIKLGVIDQNYNIVGTESIKTNPLKRPWQDVISDMSEAVESLLNKTNIDVGQCSKIGVGSPGMIDHIEGTVVFSGNLGWDNVPLARQLGKYYNLPISLSNDANCAVYGEYVAGAAKGCKNVVLITLGTGIGGGVVSNCKLQEGGSAGGMELGHTLLVMDGYPCTCGRKGCLESYASATALVRQAKDMVKKHPNSRMLMLCEGDIGKMNGKIPFQAAKLGDKPAKHVVENYIKYLGEGIIDFINIWRPEKVLLGGGISHEGDPLITPLNQYIAPRAFAGNRGFVATVERAMLGNNAGLIGAAAL